MFHHLSRPCSVADQDSPKVDVSAEAVGVLHHRCRQSSVSSTYPPVETRSSRVSQPRSDRCSRSRGRPERGRGTGRTSRIGVTAPRAEQRVPPRVAFLRSNFADRRYRSVPERSTLPPGRSITDVHRPCLQHISCKYPKRRKSAEYL